MSILQACQDRMPAERWCYVADHACFPYGALAPEQIEDRALAIARWLSSQPVKAIVIACNTASSYALEAVREACPNLPVVGVTPAVKPAAGVATGRPIIVLATPATAKSNYLRGLIDSFAAGLRVEVVPAPGLVELVESGVVTGDVSRSRIEEVLEPVLAQHPGVIVLGCTHFPFLRRSIEEIAGPEVMVVDSGAAIASRLHQVLQERGFLAPTGQDSHALFFTTGQPEAAARVARLLLGEPVSVRAVRDIAPLDPGPGKPCAV